MMGGPVTLGFPLMHPLDSLLVFASTQFPRHPRDEELANAETMHGYALARHIADGLRDRGFGEVELIAEDWGWYCEVPNSGYALMYGVCNEEDTKFLVQFSPRKPVIRRWFRKIEVETRVRALQQAVFDILERAPGRTDGPRFTDQY